MTSPEDELRNYEEQIRILEAQLAEEPSEELQETLNDLLELVALLREELGYASTSQSSTSQEDGEEDEGDEEDGPSFDDLVGSRVMAMLPAASQVVKYHAAIILDVEENDGKIQARLLFSNPLTPSMKPCPYFLKDSCRFESKCKFSHGELLGLEHLEEYTQSDFGSLKEDSLVLAPIENGLWDVGRIAVMDAEESAVKLLNSGKEISSKNCSLIPLGEVAEDRVEETASHMPNTSWSELKQERLGDVVVGDLGQWSGGGFGLKMLQKMGYKLGQGLGKNSDGIVHAVQARIFPKGKGLDSGEGVLAAKKKKPRKRKALLPVGEQESEIFTFINRKLAGKPENESKTEVEERKKMKDSTESSLGSQNVSVEMELKKMKSNERKLTEGISRNLKTDPKTAAKLQQRLEALRKDISRMERQHTNIKSEQSSRRDKKKEIF